MLSANWISHDTKNNFVEINFSDPVSFEQAFQAAKYMGYGAVCTLQEWNDSASLRNLPVAVNDFIKSEVCKSNNLQTKASGVLPLIRRVEYRTLNRKK